jgi:hypothetical protein
VAENATGIAIDSLGNLRGLSMKMEMGSDGLRGWRMENGLGYRTSILEWNFSEKNDSTYKPYQRAPLIAR